MYDVVIIGGGPAGSSSATRLAQAGHRVLLCEKEGFPRFHVGESLLPSSMPLFERLGVAGKLEQHGFLPKYAAEFVTADGSSRRRYPFNEGLVAGPSSAYEVLRSDFDRLLLDNAREHGVEVRESVEVRDVHFDARGVELALGSGEHVRGSLLIDASGQRSLVASQLGLRRMDPDLKNVAMYCHVTGAKRHAGEPEGDVTIVLIPGGWCWVIPLRDDKSSVGIVLRSGAAKGKRTNDELFDETVATIPYLVERLESAKRVVPVGRVSDFSYCCSQFAGDRWLLVGDAAAFIDPIFSTGIYLGMEGGFRAAAAADRALRQKRFERARFQKYERWVERTVDMYRSFVKGFYDPAFVEILMRPSDHLSLRQAVTSLLAGESNHFGVTWRIWLFRAIVRANRWLPLAPRIAGRREAAATA